MRGLLLLMVVLTLGNSAIAEEKSADKPVELLVTVEGLKQLLEGDKGSELILLDCRDRSGFAAGHLPNSHWVEVSRWKATALKANGAGLKDKAGWQRIGRGLGLTRNSHIVVYGGSLPSAARIWWLLKYIGCNRVSLLDGGIKAWQQAGHPTTKTIAAAIPSQFKPVFQTQRLAGIEEVKRAAKGDDVIVFDTRSDGEFSEGRVPRAVHIEWSRMLTKQGTFKSRGELQKMFRASPLGPKKIAVTYCRSGGRASVEAFALELAGYKNVKNYFCSWQQYRKDETAEVEK